jgi:hypothetical protein
MKQRISNVPLRFASHNRASISAFAGSNDTALVSVSMASLHLKWNNINISRLYALMQLMQLDIKNHLRSAKRALPL